MEKMQGGRSNKSQYLKFLKAWQKAGFPAHFRCDKNFQRVLDSKALREQLQQRLETPEQRNERLLKFSNELRYKMMKF